MAHGLGAPAGSEAEPVITVITPFAPADRQFLERAYASLAAQSLENWEWIVSEDGPTDTARDLPTWDSRITWVNSGRSSGPAAARNMAAAVARGPLVRNLDADDEIAGPRVLEQTVAAFAEHPQVQYVVGPVVDRLVTGQLRRFDELIEPGLIPPGALYEFWRDKDRLGAVHPTGLAVRTGAFFRAGGYPALAAAEDTAFLFALGRQDTGLFVDFDVAVYNKRPTSVTQTHWYRLEGDRALREACVERLVELGRGG